MSNHVAAALLVFTALQLLVTMRYLSAGASRTLPLLTLAMLVGVAIPGCRWLERRWAALGDEAGGDPALGRPFRRDIALLWAVALALPVGLAGALDLAVGLIAL
jgi:hypothetical protein